jgi:peroxiredoxin Q/BCP
MFRLTALISAVALLAAPALAAEEVDTVTEAAAPAVTVGSEAPDFEIPREESEEPGTLSDYRGENFVVVAFYPKAFTGGCTKQMCGYRDDMADLEELDAEIVAVSTDPQTESSRFKSAYNLGFPVVGDPAGNIVESYGIDMGDRGFATRSVFVVDKQGDVRYIDREYDLVKGRELLYQKLEDLKQEEQAKAASQEDASKAEPDGEAVLSEELEG